MQNYLRFTDEETAKRCCPEWLDGDNWMQPTLHTEIAVRGTLYNDDGEYDEEGNTIKEPTQKVGFFVDVIRGEIPSAARQYIVHPTTPDFILG
ncbi:hypothetical protein LPW36_02045 [Jinshanibacter sp. LJY008]|uniref:Uncharacterized protein n=1 Tax=Limnobaculum eriocheiris TaxID=2897391 RepID=A0A9X1MSQ2_9GAMM|nr:hypothetical protein [Limnobaculum eriocheiris]MCD1124826.1 hypothetical protein [Limnobaculum eriocheiris]